MLLTGKIKLKQQTTKVSSAVYIPKTSVLWTGKRSVVYVKTKPNQPVFEMRKVVLGRETTTTYQIISGLEAGEEIVVNGTFTVDAAAQIQGKKSMMNQTNKVKQEKHKDRDISTTKKEKTGNPKVRNSKKTNDMKCEAGKCGG